MLCPTTHFLGVFMGVEELVSGAVGAFTGGILTDVFAVCMAVVNIMIVLAGGRIIYAVITHQSVIPRGLSDDEKEYNGILDQEEDHYRKGILHDRAKDEVLTKHKYDSWT